MKTPQSSASSFAWISGCAVLFLVAAVILPLIGPTGLDMRRVFAKAAPDYGIFVELRITRVLLGLLAGGALALGGAVPGDAARFAGDAHTLGVSAGAARGPCLYSRTTSRAHPSAFRHCGSVPW
jgi:ABC-type Fe3+-siderophore transport system permease subunit